MTEQLKHIDPKLIDPSKTNARSHFDIEELTASVKDKGIIEPLIVRPKGKTRFELVCGERRWRAAKAAELSTVPCVVRDLTDEEALDQQTIENLHRNDLTPLEQAKQFRLHINQKLDKHAAEKIAAKAGKSASWVWDVMKILDLIPEAKRLLEQGRMTLNHAIPIARLTKEQQESVIHPDTGGLFQREDGLGSLFSYESDREARKVDPYSGFKTRSVRELNAWISKYVRFDVKQAAKAAPMLFEPVAEAVKAAEDLPGRGKKVIPITYSYHVAPEAKDEEGERTYGPTAWHRADGSDKNSPACDYSVLGTVVVGPEYGSAFKVCIARDKCKVHFGQVIKEKAKRERDRASGKGDSRQSERNAYEARQRREQLERQRRDARWSVFYPSLKKEMETKLSGLPQTLPKSLWQALVKQMELPKDTKPTDLARVLVNDLATSTITRLNADSYWENGANRMIEWAKLLGVSVDKIEKATEEALNAKEVIVKADRFEEIKKSLTNISITSVEPHATGTPFRHFGKLMVAVGGVFAPGAPKDLKTTGCLAYELVPVADYKGKSRKTMTEPLRKKLGPDHGTRVKHDGAEWVLVGPRTKFLCKS